MTWIPWTGKSEHVSFVSDKKGVGDGEDKVAHELNTAILGQNSSYDMKYAIGGIEYECDVKKLDKDGSFNTGVKGRNALRPFKHEIENLFTIFVNIRESKFLSQDEKDKLIEFEDVSPDELCLSNLKKLYEICSMLHTKYNMLFSSIPNLKPFIDKTGTIIEMSLYQYYKICGILQQNFPSEFDAHKDTLIILQDLSHEYISNPTKLKDSLNGLVSIFTGQKLIFVHEKKGYYICNELENIEFQRITKGNPRFCVSV